VCSSPQIIKVDFEATVITAITEIFSASVITGCNVLFNQCLWRKIQNTGMMVEYKGNERPECFLLVQKLKEEAQLVSWQLK
jgi:hypothetical protein